MLCSTLYRGQQLAEDSKLKMEAARSPETTVPSTTLHVVTPQNTITLHIRFLLYIANRSLLWHIWNTIHQKQRLPLKDIPKHGNLFGLLLSLLGNKIAYSNEVDWATMKAGPNVQCFSSTCKAHSNPSPTVEAVPEKHHSWQNRGWRQ
jgi:hypothetical protein